jgi:hypothetical protein
MAIPLSLIMSPRPKLPDGQITRSSGNFRCRVIFLSRSEIFLFIPTGKSKL